MFSEGLPPLIWICLPLESSRGGCLVWPFAEQVLLVVMFEIPFQCVTHPEELPSTGSETGSLPLLYFNASSRLVFFQLAFSSLLHFCVLSFAFYLSHSLVMILMNRCELLWTLFGKSGIEFFLKKISIIQQQKSNFTVKIISVVVKHWEATWCF